MLSTALLVPQLCLNLANLCAFTPPNISIKTYVKCTCVILSVCHHFHWLFFVLGRTKKTKTQRKVSVKMWPSVKARLHGSHPIIPATGSQVGWFKDGEDSDHLKVCGSEYKTHAFFFFFFSPVQMKEFLS